MGYNRNRLNGLEFEQELCRMLFDEGFWAHDMTQSANGQPADIIAVRDNVPVLIDCKDCKNNRFTRDRIEANQEYAMDVWENKDNLFAYFALRLNDGSVYMLPFGNINDRSTWDEYYIRHMLPEFTEWVNDFGY